MMMLRSGGMPSSTFCPLPWNHLATHPHGAITLCCEAAHDQRMSESFNNGLQREYQTLHSTEYNFEKIQNSESFSQVRLKMLNDEMPEQCKRCWDNEKVGNKSKRLIEIERLDFTEEDARKVTNDDGTITKVDYEFIELRLGNHCNTICRTCNPHSTSRWKKDYDTIFPNNAYQLQQNLFDWPLDDDFWNNLIEHCDSLKYIYINGGEPLLIDKHLSFLQQLIAKDVAQNITLVYSTNCTVINEAYEEVWKNFKAVQLMVSIDDLESRNYYIRYPTQWRKVTKTLEWIRKLCMFNSNISYNIMQTVSTYNIYYLKEFQEFFQKNYPHWTSDHGDVGYISMNFVTDPVEFDASLLPEDIKEQILNKIRGLVYLGCSDFYDTVEKHLQKSESLKDANEFLELTEKMDKVRGQSLRDTFPEFYNLLRGNKEFFCSAPFSTMYIHPTGEVKTCCIGESTFGSTKENSLEEIWHNDMFTNLRKDFISGEITDLVEKNCSTCINFERSGIHSLRDKLNQDYEHKIDKSPDTNINLLYIDVRFNNFCNFKCRTCYHEYSSSIHNEDKGSNQDIIYAGKTEDDLYNQIVPHLDHVNQIYFAGGEPLIQKEHWLILDKLKEMGRTETSLQYNTNFSTLKYKKRHITEYWNDFDDVLLLLSLDGWKEGAEYWRHGTDWEKIYSNILEVKEKCPHVQMGTTTTVSWVNLYSALDFLDHVLDENLMLEEKLNINVLQKPAIFSVQVVPSWKKDELKERIQKTLDKTTEASLLRNNLNALLDYMYEVEHDAGNSAGWKTAWDFFINRRDKLRDEDFFTAFPEHENMRQIIEHE